MMQHFALCALYSQKDQIDLVQIYLGVNMELKTGEI